MNPASCGRFVLVLIVLQAGLMLWASSLGLAAGARTEPASLSKASATSAMFFDSAVALQRANPTLVLNDAKQAVAKAREDRNDLAGALCRLGLLEFDLGHFDKAHKALEEARQLLEQRSANHPQALGAVLVGLAWTWRRADALSTEPGWPVDFVAQVSDNDRIRKMEGIVRDGLKILEESGYGKSADAYSARIFLLASEEDPEKRLSQLTSLREEMQRILPGQHRLLIELLHCEIDAHLHLLLRLRAWKADAKMPSSATKAAKEALQMARKVFGELHPLTANAYEKQGITSSHIPNEKAAFQGMLKALPIWKKIDTPEGLVQRYVAVGAAAVTLTMAPPEYITYFDKAFSLAEKVYGAESLWLLKVYGAVLGALDYNSLDSPYTETVQLRAIALAERLQETPLNLLRNFYNFRQWLLRRKMEEERNTVRKKYLQAEYDAIERKAKVLPSEDLPGNSRALKVAYQARLAWPEGGADLYRHSIALWAAAKSPRLGLLETMVEMTTQGLRKGKAAEARDLLDRAINILPEEDEAVTRAFLYLAKAACLRHAQDKGEEVEQALRAGFTDLEKAVKRSATLKLDAEELLETIFEWFRWQSEFSPSSPKDPMLVESFVIASASKPRPLREKGSVRSGLDTLAVVTAAFEALVANLNAGRYEAALAFLEHVSTEPKKYVLFEHVFPDPEKYVSRVRSTLQAVTRHSDGDKGKRRTNGDEFLAVALDRAQRLQGPSQHIVFSLALLAIERYFSFVRGDDSAQRSQGLRALSLAEKLVEDVWRPNKDDEYVLKSIELYGRYEEGILGQRLLDLSRFYVSEGTSASDQPQARPSAQPSLAEVLDGFLPLKVPPLKVLPPLKTNSQEWARIRTRQERGWERLHSKAFAAAKEALNQPNGLAAALKSSQDLVLLAEQQLLMEVQEESLWDRNGRTFNLHLTRRVYYLLALNLLHRVAQDAPELKDKVAAATVDVAQRVFRSRLAHAAVSLGSSPFLAQEQKTDAIRQELANLDDAVRRMRRDLPGSVVLEKLETERETLLARLEKAEQRVKEISSTTIKATESIVSLQDIQTQLASDEAILAYVMDTGWPPESKRYMDSDYYAVTESQVLVIRRNSAALVMLPRFTRQIDSADLSGNSYSFASLSAEIVRKTMRRMAQAKLGLPLAEDRTEPLAPLLPSAYQLYRQVLEPVRVELEGINHLIVVADGDLGGVPFGMMVMSPPKTEADTQFTKVDWLLNHFETSYIPSLDSFVALRREASSRKVAPKAFVGFGDPVFAERGTQGQPSSLPGAKRELEQIAETLQAGPNALVLGKFATEDAVRTARLEQYRIIAFATHGVLADAETGIEEPALALTPGKGQGRSADGWLTATEIAALKLNADWVLLSACNTAGVTTGASTLYKENVAGLTWPFFQAGALSLLVSHWPVSSDATMRLTIETIAEGVPVGTRKSAALAAAMRRLASGEFGDQYAHPFYWAPFVIVGDSGPVRR